MRTVPVVPAAVVEAAQAGDTGALEELVAAYLPLLYNIVGRALDQPADVDDVVQETLLRAVGNLPALREPERFRSWLAAIAVRQIRNRIQERQTLRARTRPLAPAEAVPEPDFADVTILRLGLDGQRQDLAEAVRWLDPDDRDLLSLWCLELMGELTRDDLLTALQLSPSHVAVRLHRLRAQLETSRAVVAAVRHRSHCASLGQIVDDWDGSPSPLWRKRVARHLGRDCPICGTQPGGLIPVEKLMRSLFLTPVPVGLGAIWLLKATSAGSAATVSAHTIGTGALVSHGFLTKPLALATAGLTVLTAGVGSTLFLQQREPAPAPPAVVASPTPTSPRTPTASPRPRITPTRRATPSKTAAAQPRGLYGSVVDAADKAPKKARRPAPLPDRPQTGVNITASQDNDPRAEVVSLIYRGQNVTYQGQGYIRVEYQLPYHERSGPVAPPSWTGLRGKLFHVASGGGMRMDDAVPGAEAGATHMGNDADGFDVLPPKAQQMWHFEYYYLDGTVTLNQNERGADYNLYIHLVSRKQIRDDLFTPPAADGPLRYGLTRDNGEDTTPVPQYATRKNPADPTTVPQLSRLAG
ncbi:hypothetical protein Kisp01_37340 [Kineosporia sp. NBRC 101677]|uniref:RNA polymerase sigma factor n=1 Tax=Kineosporia sp. NBRC 101677 TaxID=3032197 RepID=UPI0024A0653B|nr:sigma-70 family RNA polymerase sigma factor [Kineosporia sp. NBRC 101677]GLY16719.1 hypothetical protein Kisp01_37340 [Kineosporia sp. NBRC 101677]